jgi:hypothetical protein
MSLYYRGQLIKNQKNLKFIKLLDDRTITQTKIELQDKVLPKHLKA